MVYFTPGCPSRTPERRSWCLNSRLRTKASRGSLDFPKQTSASSVSGLARSAALFRADQKRRKSSENPQRREKRVSENRRGLFFRCNFPSGIPSTVSGAHKRAEFWFQRCRTLCFDCPSLSAKGSLLPFHCLTTSCQHGPLRRMTLYSSGHFSLTAQRSLATWILF